MSGDRLGNTPSRGATVMPRVADNQREILDDRYSIARMIGRGGMGAIYLGEDRKMQKRVAIKMLHGHVAFDGEEVLRFHREAIAISQIGNPHIVSATDIGTLHDGRTFIVLELLEGQNLRSALGAGAMDIKRAMMITQQALDAIGAAHAAGFIHRDLKPENIFLTKQRNGDDFVKLLDFGIAALIAPGANTKLTQTGNLIGTPVYMAPEQARSKPFDHRIDIYALGVILFELLTGQQPFSGDSLYDLLRQVVNEPLPRVTALRPDVPTWLEAIVCRATAKPPDERYPTAEEFMQALPMARATFGMAAVPPEQVAKIIAHSSANAPPSAVTAAPAAVSSEHLQAHTVKIAMREHTAGALAGLQRDMVISAGVVPVGSMPQVEMPLGFRRAAWIAGALTALVGTTFAWWRLQRAPQPVAEIALLDAQVQPVAEIAALDPRYEVRADRLDAGSPVAHVVSLDAPKTYAVIAQESALVGQTQQVKISDKSRFAPSAKGEISKPAPGKPGCDGAVWATDAAQLFNDNDYVGAMRAYEAAFRCTGNSGYARIAGIAACKSKNVQQARNWYRITGGSSSIAQSCLQQIPNIKMFDRDEDVLDIGGAPLSLIVKTAVEPVKGTREPAAGASERNQTIDPFAPTPAVKRGP